MGQGRRQGTTVVLALSGLGGLLLAVEAAAIAVSPVPLTDTWLAGVLMTLPLLVGLAYGGYWLDASTLAPDRDARILRWTAGGLTGVVLLNVPLMIASPPRSLLSRTSWLRWAAVRGTGLGLAVGLFERRVGARNALNGGVAAMNADRPGNEGPKPGDRLRFVRARLPPKSGLKGRFPQPSIGLSSPQAVSWLRQSAPGRLTPPPRSRRPSSPSRSTTSHDLRPG